MTFLFLIFIRKENECKYTKEVERHEYIHIAQQFECLILGILMCLLLWVFDCSWYSLIPVGLFYWVYGLEFLVKLPLCNFNRKMAYYSVSFESEAFKYQNDLNWVKIRPRFYWIRYIITLL